ncbi:hypothetical protein EGW08_018528 [Elysia chlorotica]|uniref:Rho-GAP domain-containing protein n=1 Tax=Elysia chlorotica TaxID=188477 RepID=A0A3S0ZRQ4_ELYCH|nr:hypothetical protein EGW08_018528 [Elysia chlorotica]
MNRRKDKDLRGWLRRKGGRMNTWSRRWFVLTDRFLFMYAREEETKSSDCITLDEHIIVEPPVDLHEPKRVYFDIVTDSSRSPSETVLSLCAESEEEKKVWIRALKRALYADKGGALFSQSLEEILSWGPQAGTQIPFIITECVEYLVKNALDVEGIFRLPGRQSVIKDIISRFERAQKVNFDEEETDVHAVASVLKAFLRDLPDSIIPCSLFQRFMNFALRFQGATCETEKGAVVGELASAMSAIPKDNYVILKYICRFLQEVGLHESENKMSMMNLGTVFGYNIIRHIDKENSELFLCTADLSQNLVYMLINYYPVVFALEYSDHGTVANNVPIGDLLRMSSVLDIPPVLPQTPSLGSPSHVADLEGIDFVHGLHPPSSHGPSITSLLNDDDSAFLNSAEVQEEIARRPSLLRVMSQPIGSSRSLPASPTVSSPPVAPERKSKKLSRRRGVSERRRPEGIVVVSGEGAPNGPLSPQGHPSPAGVNSEDVIAALAKANLLHTNNAGDADGASPDTESSEPACGDHSETQNGSTGNPRPVPSVRRHRIDSSDNRIKFLQQQVEQLTEELSEQKKQQRKQVSALQSQLLDIMDKYEKRVQALEAQRRSETDRLEAKLRTEQEACASAVACTIQLKEELHRYQMQYGELPS